jgi:hypothetical protein
MSRDTVALPLHDKSTRGVELTPDERRQLDDWYMSMDEQEAAAGAVLSPRNSVLQYRIENTLAELLSVTQRIQSLDKENQELKIRLAIMQNHAGQK